MVVVLVAAARIVTYHAPMAIIVMVGNPILLVQIKENLVLIPHLVRTLKKPMVKILLPVGAVNTEMVLILLVVRL